MFCMAAPSARLDGGGIAVFHADELGNRAVDAAKLSGCRVLA